MLPSVAIPSRLPGSASTPHSPRVASEPMLSRRRTELAAEARRLARRRLIAEEVSRRSRENDRGLRGEASALISGRAKRRATHLRVVFHRAIETLWEAGGFDEALAIFREHKADIARRAAPIARRR